MQRVFTDPSPGAASPAWSLPVERLLADVQSTAAGLTTAEARRRLTQVGPNLLQAHDTFAAWRLLLRQFSSPLVLILLFAAGVSAFLREWVDMAVIVVIVVASALIAFFQEYGASRAVAALRARLAHMVTALRDGRPASIPAETLVPGDIVLLAAGSLVPADGVLLAAKDLYVTEAALTGETFPVLKQPGPVSADAPIGRRSNCAFQGTTVHSGAATLLVVQTGGATAYGQIAGRLRLRPPETEFERGIRHFGMLLTQVMLVLILVVFTINVITVKPAIDALLFAIALAVGISPELLPAIISINLSKGARAMARGGVIVRRLSAIENLGSMDVLCTDKTGTLTGGVIQLDGAFDPQGAPSPAVLHLAVLNAGLQAGLPNPLDAAIVAREPAAVASATKLDEIPFDFARKRLGVVVREGAGATLIVKGAFDSVLAVCSSCADSTGCVPLDEARRAALQERFAAWSAEGYRVLALATRAVAPRQGYTRADERDLTFRGFLRFFDAPKPGAREAIATLARLGVAVKVISGDNRFVTAHVAALVGLPAEGVVTGDTLDQLSEEALRHTATRATLFAEVDPGQKERILRALQRAGHVVGFLGDGINDAPALHDADVGISVDDATEVAREAADIVLLQSDLEILRRGIEEGRTTFANSLKYVFTTTSANFGNMLSMAAASLVLPFLPLLAKQILLNNFLSDFPAIALAGDRVDPEYITAPRRWDMGFIRRFMVVFGLVSSAFDILTFWLLLRVVGATPAQFRTGWFVESLLTELLVALVVRTRRPCFRSRPGGWLLGSTAIVVIFALALPYLPGAALLEFVPLPPAVLALIVVVTLGYVLVVEATKHVFYARAGAT
jgi:Mg2+-importing ATPase